MSNIKPATFARSLPYIVIIGSIIGIFTSSILIYDQIKIWQDPYFIPDCTINPLLSCGSVIASKEGHVLGVPAPFFGLITFPALAAFGMLLASGAQFKRRVWLGLQVAATGAVLFALWLFWVSLYKINALCPYCLLTDAAIYIMAWYITLYNIERGYLLKSTKLSSLKVFIRSHHLDLLIGVFLLVAAVIVNHFWYYYGHYLN